MFAVSAPGLERFVASEIEQLGIAGGRQVDGGVTFTGNLAQLYKANLSLRTATRVLVRVDEFHASSFHELERRAKRIHWAEYLRPGSRFQFRVTCRKSRLYHSDAVAERFTEAVIQQVEGVAPALAGQGPADDIDDEPAEESPTQLFVVRLSRDNCVVSVDSSGSLLHRRGYRQATGKAPLRETLAAAMVIGSGWDGVSPLIDPMCGSGTIVIEAALIARRIPPGIAREFAFQSWPGYDQERWESLLDEARSSALSAATGVLMASDRDDGAATFARENAQKAGVASDIDVLTQPISAVQPPALGGWLITNPPYGVRIGERRALRNLYAQLGNIIRLRARGYTVALLSSDLMLESMLQLRLEQVFATRNGGIPVRLMKGSLK
jgi:putative N6-adenine-specific DNA methylase